MYEGTLARVYNHIELGCQSVGKYLGEELAYRVYQGDRSVVLDGCHAGRLGQQHHQCFIDRVE
jgi:hypothetical protein